MRDWIESILMLGVAGFAIASIMTSTWSYGVCEGCCLLLAYLVDDETNEPQ